MPTTQVKVDVENSILHYLKDGGVLRLNRYTISTKYANRKGGISEQIGGNEQLISIHTAAATELKQKYPKLGFLKRSKLYGMNFQLKLLK